MRKTYIYIVQDDIHNDILFASHKKYEIRHWLKKQSEHSRYDMKIWRFDHGDNGVFLCMGNETRELEKSQRG
jgi:hypothetical protein